MPATDVVLCGGYTVLCAAPDGAVLGTGRHGLYDTDTRLLRRLRWTLGGADPELVASDQPTGDRWDAVLVVRIGSASRGIAGPQLPQDALQLEIHRSLGPGMTDVVRVTNESAAAWQGELVLECEPDFADVQEVVADRRQHGDLAVEIDETARTVGWHYVATNQDRTFERALRLRVSNDVRVCLDGHGLTFALDLPPHATWSTPVQYESLVDGRWRTRADDDGRADWAERWRTRRARIDAPGWVGDVLERAADDLGALRQWDWPSPRVREPAPAPEAGPTDPWFPNAGLPMFTGFFGRDTLTAGYQALMLAPDMAYGALEVAAETQATTDDPWRDEEPGKMVHEMRRGPLSVLNVIPQAAYYGSETTGAMFVLALAEAWHWTGDDELLRRYRDPALRTFEWARRHGDLDGDGFLEYRQRSPAGLKNQGWKDSDEAIRYPDGGVVEDPIATIEEQAFHCLALERMAEILVALDEPDRADALLREGHELRHKWHDAYWLDDEGFYALALDPDKRQVASITSNPGHALAAGIVPVDCARRVADRLLEPDLFSGWGVRTLSSAHPSFNPYGYHLGTMWPVEQATFALGFKRYGLDDHLDRLVAAAFEAAGRRPDRRLPELLAGIGRDAMPVPVAYPETNTPQAWSASATIQLLQASLGLYPFAPLNVLALVRPRLPAFLPEVTLHRLRIGSATVTMRFTRRPDGSADHEVLEQDGRLFVVSAPAPQLADGSPSLLDRFERAALTAAPGRLARALRIALGIEAERA